MHAIINNLMFFFGLFFCINFKSLTYIVFSFLFRPFQQFSIIITNSWTYIMPSSIVTENVILSYALSSCSLYFASDVINNNKKRKKINNFKSDIWGVGYSSCLIKQSWTDFDINTYRKSSELLFYWWRFIINTKCRVSVTRSSFGHSDGWTHWRLVNIRLPWLFDHSQSVTDGTRWPTTDRPRSDTEAAWCERETDTASSRVWQQTLRRHACACLDESTIEWPSDFNESRNLKDSFRLPACICHWKTFRRRKL